MNKFDYERNLKILDVLIGLKFLYIILAALNIISYYNVNLDMNSIVFIVILVCCIAPLMIYCSKAVHREQNKNFFSISNIYNVVEIVLLLGLFIVLMRITGGSSSSFKYIGTIIVLISSIQYSKELSFIITIIVSLIILSFNFLSFDYTDTTSYMEPVRYFEGDIILVSSLLITSFILCLYINIENNYNLKLKELAIKDGLTGLANHRSFQDTLDSHINNAKKEGKEVSLLFMDIDNFKNYNDINGHQKGDWLLAKLGEVLKNTVGDLGTVARYGGEEFAVVLYNQCEETALNLGELIRKNIQQTDFKGQEYQPNNHITVSIGVATYPKVAKTKKQLIELADNALYRAKSFDKNRVEKYYNILDEIDNSIDKRALESIANMLNKINKNDKYTYGHSERVVIYAKKFAAYLELDEKCQKDLLLAAYLHDIGKLEISKELLNKRERLSETEFNILKQHPTLGSELISNIQDFNEVEPIIKHHHEKFDGTGYPSNLKGENIPYLARILTIVDSFDAMTSKRPYNIRKNYNEAIVELKRCAGTHFDRYLVLKFVEMLEKDMLDKNVNSELKNMLVSINE